MNYFEKNRRWKDFFISFILLLAVLVVVFNFIGVSEGATNKDIANKGFISKNLKVKSITISNSTVGGLKGAVEKSKNGTTIYLKKGVYKFNNTDIKVNKTLTIVGKGSAKYIVIDAKNQGRIFKIVKNGNLNLINITLSNAESIGGGAIYNNGRLSIKNSVFKNNIAQWDFDGLDGGGAIYNTGKLNIISTTFLNNIANFDGGAIYNKGNLNIVSTTFLNNIADLDGGAIYNKGYIIIKSSSFKENDGFFGGVVSNFGKLNINNSVFKKNFAYDGGAIINSGKITIFHSTFSENSANSYGGAIYNSGKLNILNSYFKKNFAENANAIFNYGRLTLYKSKFKDNYYKEYPDIYLNKKEIPKIYLDKEEIFKNNFVIQNGDKGKIIAKLNNFSGTESGIYSYSTKYCLFENNMFKSLETAIYIEGNRSKIKKNKIYSCINGIVINGKENLISKNIIIKSKDKYGIYEIKKYKSNKISQNKIDKFIIDYNSVVPVKKSKSKKNLKLIHWKAYGSSKSVTVFSHYSLGKYKSNIKKTIIKKISKNKLKISSKGTVKYVKTKYGPKYYYLKIYKPKMLKNTIKKGVFDNGSGYILHGSYSIKSSWKAKIDGEKIVIYEYCNDSNFLKNSNLRESKNSTLRTIVIEKSGNELKFTIETRYIAIGDGLYPAFYSSTNTYYLKKNLSPLEYYLKVYKPIITKNSPSNSKSGIPQFTVVGYSLPPGHNCISMPHPIPTPIPIDYSIGDLYYIQGSYNDSDNNVSWNITRPINGTIVIEKNYSSFEYGENFTTKIETFESDILKITILYLNREENIDFIETNLTTENYFKEIYKEKINNELKNLTNIFIRSSGVPWFSSSIILIYSRVTFNNRIV